MENDVTNHLLKYKEIAIVMSFLKSALKCGKRKFPTYSYDKFICVFERPLKIIRWLKKIKRLAIVDFTHTKMPKSALLSTFFLYFDFNIKL